MSLTGKGGKGSMFVVVVLLKLVLLLALVQLTYGRSIEELYKVDVAEKDTLASVLKGHHRPDKSPVDDDDDDDDCSGSGEDHGCREEQQLHSAAVAAIVVGVVLVCGAIVAVLLCCLCGCCCFAKKKNNNGPANNMNRRKNTAIVIGSVIPPMRQPGAGGGPVVAPSTEKSKNGAGATGVGTQPRVSVIATAPAYDDTPPSYYDVAFIPVWSGQAQQETAADQQQQPGQIPQTFGYQNTN